MDRVRVDGELSNCPKCGAGGGFHVAFRRESGRAGKLGVEMVCPSCRFRFSVGEFLVPDGEPRPFDPSVDSGP